MQYYIGLMSGTSLDGVDAVLYTGNLAQHLQQKNLGNSHCFIAFSDSLKQQLLNLNKPGYNEAHLMQLASHSLMQVYANCVTQLLAQNNLKPADIIALGAHGQTIRHQPQMHDLYGYSIQLCEPSLLAQLTHIDVISHFRQADIYAGGQGAPLVPLFHQQLLHSLEQNHGIICNIGGMSNLTYIYDEQVIGFDCGPGNVLLDTWINECKQQPYDEGGNWASGGHCLNNLLTMYLEDDFFKQPFPKSTGRDTFNQLFIKQGLQKADIEIEQNTQSIQTTLTHLTAQAIYLATMQACIYTEQIQSQILPFYICGGGAYNHYLINVLQQKLSNFNVQTIKALHPMHVEALTFAWLAQQRMEKNALNYTTITGSKKPVILGGIYAGN